MDYNQGSLSNLYKGCNYLSVKPIFIQKRKTKLMI